MWRDIDADTPKNGKDILVSYSKMPDLIIKARWVSIPKEKFEGWISSWDGSHLLVEPDRWTGIPK